jgi:hypothetical protein
MYLNEARDAFSRAKPLLRTVSDLVEAVGKAADLEKEVKALQTQKTEAETGYRQAHEERAQIIEAIENLKTQYAKSSADLAARYAEQIKKLEQSVEDAKIEANSKILAAEGSAKMAESYAAQRITAAEIKASEVEERVEKAKKALADLKGA